MTFILGIIQLILIAYILWYEFRRKSAAVFLWATLLIMFGFMHFITSAAGDLVYSNRILMKASLFVIAFCFLYLFVRKLCEKSLNKSYFIKTYEQIQISVQKENFSDSLFFYMLIIILSLWHIPLIIYSGGIFNTSWGMGRDYASTRFYINSGQLLMVWFYAFSGSAVLFWLKNKKLYFYFILVLILVNVIVTRNRIEVLPFLCSIITIYLLKTDRIKMRTLIFALASGIVAIYVVYGLWVFRHYGSINDFLQINLSEFIGTINLHLKKGEGELGLLRNMYYFIYHDNNFINFGEMHTYWRMLLVYLPTAFSFGIKPPDFAISMGSAIGMQTGGSTHPTLFGDCYANAGTLGIFLGVFWALYVSVADRIVKNRKTETFRIFAFVLNAVAYVVMGRGSVYNSFTWIAFGIPLLILFEWAFFHLTIHGVKIKDLRVKKMVRNKA